MSNMNSSSKERKKERKQKETIQSDVSWSGEFHLCPGNTQHKNQVFVKLGSYETLNWWHMIYMFHCDLIQSV